MALAALAALAVLGGCRPRRAGPARPRSLVLVTIDTLRADHVGTYGYPRATTPWLDRLAGRGVVFDNAFSSSSHTGPAHASLMTSRQPFQHGLQANGQRLAPGNRTLADLLAAAGYETAAFTSVGFLVELRQGFGRFDAARRTGERTVDAAIAWLDSRRASPAPFFLWVHLYDPHGLQAPRPELREDVERLRPQTAAARRGLLDLFAARGLPSGFYPSEEAALGRYGFYDAGIRYADRQLGRLYRRVSESHPGALWIVTSDHGEGLGNHRYDEHGRFLYDEQIKVPLIVVGAAGPPRRIGRIVRLVDLYPTVAAWLGRLDDGDPPAVQGYPLFEEPSAPGPLSPRLAFAERRPKGRRPRQRDWEEGDVASLRGAGFQYVYHSQGGDELYDLAADPLELDNRITEEPAGAAALRRLLLGYRDAPDRRPEALDGEAVEREHEAELKALGYL